MAVFVQSTVKPYTLLPSTCKSTAVIFFFLPVPSLYLRMGWKRRGGPWDKLGEFSGNCPLAHVDGQMQ